MKPKLILAAIMTFPLLFSTGCNPKEETILKITAQPQAETTIDFPDGFTLSVGVNNEKLVKSYQWQIDNGKVEDPYWVDLDCVSGRTKELIKMSTDSNTKDKRYRCILTDQEGKETITDDAWVKINNKHEYKDVVSFAGYAIKAGETFDLANTNLGTGTIEYNPNGYEVTLHDLCFDNSNPIYDYYDTSVAFDILNFNCPHKSFIINVDGINNMTNTFWQESENSGGIIFCFNFMSNTQIEKVVFQGEGTLSMCGGTHLIYANTKVEVNCDMVFNKIDSRYATGIYADEIEIKDDVNIDANLNGFLFQSDVTEAGLKGGIKIDSGVNINCISTIPHVSVGSTDFHLISAMNGLTMEGCNLNYIVNCDKTVFKPGQGVGQVVGLQAHKGDLNIKNCKINGRFVSNNPKSANFMNQKFLLAENGNIKIESSELESVSDDSKYQNAWGMYALKNITVIDSNVDLVVHASGLIEGISSNGTVSLNNSSISVDYKSFTETAISRGIICCGLSLANNSYLDIKSEKGIAILVQVGAGDEKKVYDDSYVPTVLNNTNIISPDACSINQYSIAGSIHNYVYMETIYASGETNYPVSSCSLSSLD